MNLTNNKQLFFFAKKARLLLLFLVLGSNSWATTYYSQATGNWNSSATWGTVACGNATNAGTFPVAGDIVNICNGHTITCTVDAACASITFTGAAATLTVNTAITLTVSGALTLNSVNGVTQACTISGAGTITCGSVAAGINLGANGSNVTTTMTSSISIFNCNGNLTITSSKPGTKTNNTTLTVSSGTLTVTGTLTTSNIGTCTSAFTLGNTSPMLILSGATPWSLSGTGTNTITLNGTGSTVNYSYSGAQTVHAVAYNNLEISGSGIKTIGGNITFTAAGILTVRNNCELANAGFTITTSAAANSLVLENSNTFPGGIISGAGSLTLGSDVTVSTVISGTATAGATISCPLNLNGATRTFTVADDGSSVSDLLLTGAATSNSGAITKNGAGSLTLSGTNTFRSGVILNAGTLIAKSASAFGNSSFSTLTLNGGTLDLQIDASINAYPTTVGGSATIISNKASAASVGIIHTLGTLAIGAFTLIINGGSNVTSGTAGITFGAVTHSAAPIYTVNDPAGGGTTQLSIGAVGAANFLVTFNGSGDVIQTGAMGTNTAGITYSGTGILTLSQSNLYSGPTSISSGEIILGSTTALGTSSVTTVSTGAVLDLKGFTLTTARPLTLNGTGISSGGALINTGAAANYTGAITLASASSIGTTGNITLTSNGIVGAQDLTKIGAGTLNLGTGSVTIARLTISAGTLISTAGNLTMSGNFVTSGTYTHNSGTVILNGTALQTIGTNNTDFYNLTISNSSTAGVTMACPATVANTLTLTDGIINSDVTNFITMKAGSAVSPVGGTATEYVDGPIAKAGTTAFIFPTGNGTKWARIGLGVPTAAATFKAQYFAGAYTNTTSFATTPTPVLKKVSKKEYWTLDEDDPTVDATVTLYWEDASFSSINDCTTGDLKLAHWNGTNWENNNDAVTYTGTCVGIVAGSVSTNLVVTSFSPFTFGSITADLNINPLPIELLSFDTKSNGKKVDITWVTASETNNDYFTIERTIDGVNYEVVETIKGNGNSTNVVHYASEDNIPYDGVSYYRLKQTDFDGKVTYSDLKMINFGKENDFSINIYSNPNDGNVFYLKTAGNYDDVQIVVHDLLGTEMYSKSFISNEDNDNVYTIEPSQKLKPGIYIISATSKDKIYNKRLVIN